MRHMIIFKLIGALIVFLLVLVGEFWLMAQLEPPGGVKTRMVYLVIMVAVAAFFAWSSMQPTIDDSVY